MAEEQPDWLADVLKEAKEKTDTNPAFQPPPVSQTENDYLSTSVEERKKKDKFIDRLIVIFILLCFLGVLYIIFTT